MARELIKVQSTTVVGETIEALHWVGRMFWWQDYCSRNPKMAQIWGKQINLNLDRIKSALEWADFYQKWGRFL